MASRIAHLLLLTFVFLPIPLLAQSGATEIPGEIAEVRDDRSVRIALSGDLAPRIGDAVRIRFRDEVPGAGVVFVRGEWSVSSTDSDGVVAVPSGETAVPQVGQLAVILSDDPQRRNVASSTTVPSAEPDRAEPPSSVASSPPVAPREPARGSQVTPQRPGRGERTRRSTVVGGLDFSDPMRYQVAFLFDLGRVQPGLFVGYVKQDLGEDLDDDLVIDIGFSPASKVQQSSFGSLTEVLLGPMLRAMFGSRRVVPYLSGSYLWVISTLETEFGNSESTSNIVRVGAGLEGQLSDAFGVYVEAVYYDAFDSDLEGWSGLGAGLSVSF